jgi:hypothetical protein
MIREADGDGDGRVTFDEFVKMSAGGGDDADLVGGTYPKCHAQMLAKVPKIPPKYPKSHARMLAKVPKMPPKYVPQNVLAYPYSMAALLEGKVEENMKITAELEHKRHEYMKISAETRKARWGLYKLNSVDP